MSSENYHAAFSGFLLCSGIVLPLKGFAGWVRPV